MNIRAGQRYRVTLRGMRNGYVKQLRTIIGVSEYSVRYQIRGYRDSTSDDPAVIQNAIIDGDWVLDNDYPQSLCLPLEA